MSLYIVQALPESADAAYAQASAEILQELMEILTRPFVVSLADMQATRYESAWERNEAFSKRREATLLAASQTTAFLLTCLDPATARAWFYAPAPTLEDRIPVRVFRHVIEGQEPRRSLSDVLAAARTLVNTAPIARKRAVDSKQ